MMHVFNQIKAQTLPSIWNTRTYEPMRNFLFVHPGGFDRPKLYNFQSDKPTMWWCDKWTNKTELKQSLNTRMNPSDPKAFHQAINSNNSFCNHPGSVPHHPVKVQGLKEANLWHSRREFRRKQSEFWLAHLKKIAEKTDFFFSQMIF